MRTVLARGNWQLLRRGGVLACVGILVGSLVLSGCGGADDARLATFVGHWWGHTRGIDVYRSGRGKEYIGTGAARLATLTFDILRVTGNTRSG